MSDLYRDLGLTIVPPRAADAGKSFSDAELECEHGRLPGDSTPPCGCWEGEGADTLRDDRSAEVQTERRLRKNVMPHHLDAGGASV